jgi:hypothetical protein
MARCGKYAGKRLSGGGMYPAGIFPVVPAAPIHPLWSSDRAFLFPGNTHGLLRCILAYKMVHNQASILILMKSVA